MYLSRRKANREIKEKIVMINRFMVLISLIAMSFAGVHSTVEAEDCSATWDWSKLDDFYGYQKWDCWSDWGSYFANDSISRFHTEGSPHIFTNDIRYLQNNCDLIEILYLGTLLTVV
jgi:hypothetical protein